MQAQGTARPSLLASELQRRGEQELSDEDVTVLKGFAGAVHSGGTETTSASLALFSMAMILHPECQKRGQEEIDLVVGKDRLPMFADKDSLPYVTCIAQEILRCVRGVLKYQFNDTQIKQDGIRRSP